MREVCSITQSELKTVITFSDKTRETSIDILPKQEENFKRIHTV